MAFIFQAIYQTASIPVPHGYVYYPYFTGMNRAVQVKINHHVYSIVTGLLKKQGYFDNPQRDNVGTGYAVRTNEQGVLSLSLSNDTYIEQHANSIQYLVSLTYDITTGKYYTLKDLFKPNSPYVQVISTIIAPKLEERVGGYIIKPFKQIRPDQDFYIADRSLVIVLPVLEYTAHVAGNLLFPISVYDLSSIIDENNPLGKIMSGI